MACLRSFLIEAVSIYAVYLFAGCSAAADGAGRGAQVYVGPEGALAQAGDQEQRMPEQDHAVMRREEQWSSASAAPAALPGAVVVDHAGRSAPASAALLGAGGAGGLAPAPPAYAPAPTYAPAYSAPPAYPAANPSYQQPIVRSGMPTTGVHTVGASCDIPMWDAKVYVCSEWETHQYSQETWTDMSGNMRLKMPDGSKCTIVCPSTSWMSCKTASMVCKAGAWTDTTGVAVLEIDCTTAMWVYVAAFVVCVVLPFFVYKCKYDKDSSWYAWWNKIPPAQPQQGAPLAEQAPDDNAGGAAPEDADQQRPQM